MSATIGPCLAKLDPAVAQAVQSKFQVCSIPFFQILWKIRCHILVIFPSHLKKLHSILRF